jgi:hypothetical protein
VGCKFPEPDPLDPEDFDLLQFFGRCSTQLIVNEMSGTPRGVLYPSAYLVGETYGFDLRDQDVFERFQAIETETVTVLSENARAKDKNGGPGKNGKNQVRR